MATRDNTSTIKVVRVIQAQTITQGGGAINGVVDTHTFDSTSIVVDFGDIDEMGASPVGTANVAIKLEHADDDGTGSPGAYANAADSDVIGYSGLSSGVITSPQTDTALVRFGYRGSKRHLRVTLTPTGLTNGGPVCAYAVHSHPHLGPVSAN